MVLINALMVLSIEIRAKTRSSFYWRSQANRMGWKLRASRYGLRDQNLICYYDFETSKAARGEVREWLKRAASKAAIP